MDFLGNYRDLHALQRREMGMLRDRVWLSVIWPLIASSKILLLFNEFGLSELVFV